MTPVSGKEMAFILKRNGWTLLRVEGSHHIYGKTGKKVKISIPVHGNKPLKTGLCKHIFEIAELSDLL